MQPACKAVSSQSVAYLLVVFSSILASSLAVTPEDKKWLLDTLLSLRQELRKGVVPTYAPRWDVPGPVPLPTPTQWIDTDNYGYPVPTIAFPSAPTAVSKRNYGVGRVSFGLLCCNHPPTRPPRMKRPKYTTDSRWRNLVLSAIAKSFSDHPPMQATDRFQPEEQLEERPYLSYFDPSDSNQPEVHRRGVTVVKGGVSGINTSYDSVQAWHQNGIIKNN